MPLRQLQGMDASFVALETRTSPMHIGLASSERSGRSAEKLASSPIARLDEHGVLVLPGFLAGDYSTAPLRSLLRDLGYDAVGWKLAATSTSTRRGWKR